MHVFIMAPDISVNSIAKQGSDLVVATTLGLSI